MLSLLAVLLWIAAGYPVFAQYAYPERSHQFQDLSTGQEIPGQDMQTELRRRVSSMPHARQAVARPIPHLSSTGRTAVPMPGSRAAVAGGRTGRAFASPGPHALRDPAVADLTHTVFGYHPYWIPDAAAQLYRFELLSHLAYFGAAVDAGSGEIADTYGWFTSPVIDSAQAAGVRVHLVATNFGAAANRTLLTSPAARDTLVRRLVELVRLRGADGINIDFEAVPGDQRDNLTAFFAALDATLATELPGAEISAALPAVDWNDSWNAPALAQHIDLFFIMCYDYWWSGSSTAGPVAPLQGSSYNVTRTLTDWLQKGIPPARMVMGVPYYGYDWPVVSQAPQSSTQGRGQARIYARIQDMLQSHDRQWSPVYRNPWFPYLVADWRQVWYDDAESLEFKYALVKDLGIAGAGMWALGYDGEHPELWDLLARSFTRTTSATAPPHVAGPPLAGGMALTVYPQPVRAGHAAHCRFKLPAGGTAQLVIRDLLGRVRMRKTVFGGDERAVLPLQGLDAGTYLLELTSAGERSVRPFIVVR